MDKTRFILPVAIVLAALIAGGFFYVIQVNKQQSIERQQLIKLEDERRVEETKAAQTKLEYAADRKDACLDIYKTESNKWSNVRGWRYDEMEDECYIRYKEPSPKSDAKCDEIYPTGDDYGIIWFRENMLCKEGEFENNF